MFQNAINKQRGRILQKLKNFTEFVILGLSEGFPNVDISREEKTPDIFRRVSRTCGGRANIDKSITGSINALAVQPGRESMAEGGAATICRQERCLLNKMTSKMQSENNPSPVSLWRAVCNDPEQPIMILPSSHSPARGCGNTQ